MKEAITAAAAAVCGRGEPATAAAPSSQALAGSFQPSWLCDHAFAHRCMRSCWQACRDRRRREGHRFGSLKLIGCLKRRLLPPLHTLQWECGCSRTPAVAHAQARRRYRNLTVWLPPHVPSGAERCPPPPPSPLRRRRRYRRCHLRRRRSFRRHRRTPPPPPAIAPPTSCQPPQRSPALGRPSTPRPPAPPDPLPPRRCLCCSGVRALCFVVAFCR